MNKINLSVLMVLAVLCTDFRANSQHKSLKIISYNIFDSFRGDTLVKNLFAEVITKEQPDIIALQEVKGYSEKSLNDFAKSLGMQYSALQRGKGHSVALISKYPISNVKKITKNMFHGYMYANILGYHIVVAHLAPFTYMERNKEMDALIAFLNTLQKEDKVLVMGDLNAMSPADKKDYGTEKIALMKASEARNAHIRNLNNGEIDYSAMQKIIDAGYFDTWRRFNKKFEKSAPTSIKKHNNYTRIDYILANKTLKKVCLKAYMIKNELTEKISDHYPQVLELKIN